MEMIGQRKMTDSEPGGVFWSLTGSSHLSCRFVFYLRLYATNSGELFRAIDLTIYRLVGLEGFREGRPLTSETPTAVRSTPGTSPILVTVYTAQDGGDSVSKGFRLPPSCYPQFSHLAQACILIGRVLESCRNKPASLEANQQIIQASRNVQTFIMSLLEEEYQDLGLCCDSMAACLRSVALGWNLNCRHYC